MLQRAIDVAAQSRALTCTLVAGADVELMLRAVDVRRCAVIVNSEWREGIASSIRVGLASHRDDDACVFMVADQPFITVQDVNALIARHANDPDAIVALRAGAVWGTPALFPRMDFELLAKLRGDFGAKRYTQAHPARLRFVAARSAHAFADVDTDEDYERLSQLEPRT